MSNNIRHIEIRPGVFRTFKVYDSYGTRSWKTFLEASKYVTENKAKWNLTSVHREGYEYQIRVIEETIIVTDDVHMNPVPPWLV